MQEVKTFTWCDLDDVDDAAPADRYTVVINDESRTIDLCELHAKALMGELREALADHGTRATGEAPTPLRRKRSHNATKPPELHPCLWCDEVPATTSTLALHFAQAHGFPPGHKDGQRALFADVLGTTCPHCGESFTTVPGFGQHMWRTHPDVPSHVAETMVYAREHGDVHGVVAAVMAKAPGGKYKAPRRRS